MSGSPTKPRFAAASRDDLNRILGRMHEVTILEVLGLRPTIADLERVAIWAEGVAAGGAELHGRAADIAAIVCRCEVRPSSGGS